MDAGKKGGIDERQVAMDAANRLAQFFKADILIRPATAKESDCKWVIEVTGIGRFRFESDAKVAGPKDAPVVVQYKTRAKRKRTADGSGTAVGGNSVPSQA